MRRFVFGGSYFDFDADTLAYVSAYTIANGSAPSNTVIVALNSLVTGLKSNSLWNDADVILPILGTTAATQKICLKTATDKVTWSGGVTHITDGVHFDGSTGYGAVDWQAPNLYDRSAGEFITNITGGSNGWTGIFSGAIFGMQLEKSGSNCVLVATGVNTLVAVGASGVFGLRTSVVESNSANGGKHYSGGTLVDQQTPLSNPAGGILDYYIGALNQGGTAILHRQDHSNFYFFGNAFTSTQVGQWNTLITTFNTAIGR